MGKGKGRGDEHASRINYLFQAGELMAKLVPSMSQYYGSVLTVITEKTAPKKDFTMKRFMCKGCHAILKVGDNASYRLRTNKRRKGVPNILITCWSCGVVRRLPTQRNHKLDAEKKGTIIDCGTGTTLQQPGEGKSKNPSPVLTSEEQGPSVPS